MSAAEISAIFTQLTMLGWLVVFPSTDRLVRGLVLVNVVLCMLQALTGSFIWTWWQP